MSLHDRPAPELLRSDPQTQRWLYVALTVPLVAAGYYGLAIIGTVLSVPPSGFAIIWPATAFLISVLLLMPPHSWWLYLLAIVPTHFHMAYSFQQAVAPLVVVLCQLTGNFSLAIVTTLVVQNKNTLPVGFDSFQSLLRFVLLGGLAVPAVMNALILALFLWVGWSSDFWLSWRQWMLASVFPTVTLTPLVVVALRRHLVGSKTLWASYAELTLLTIALFAVSILMFVWDPHVEYLPIVLLAPLPLLLWAAVRLGIGGTALSLLIFAGVISVSALVGRGPFNTSSPIEDVLLLQVFLITISIPLMLLAALVEERVETDEALRLSEQRMLMGLQEEQQRIADTLHGSTLQHLTAIALNLMTLRTGTSTHASTTKIVEDIEASLQEAVRELRSFSYALHPREIDRDGIAATLERYVDGFSRRTGLQVVIELTDILDALPPKLQEALLRIVQEALANVHRHAAASKVDIKFNRVRKRLHLIVADNGRGVAGDSHKHQTVHGVGIPGMRARVRQFGGEVHIRSRRGHTIVHAVVPIIGATSGD
jgi:signal transduction histidine kinase